MEKKDVFDVLQQIIKGINPMAEINEQTALIADSTLDSLEFMSYITLIEEKFEVSISDSEIENLKLGIIANMIYYLSNK